MCRALYLLIAVILLGCNCLEAQALEILTNELPPAIKGARYETPIVTYTNGRCPQGDVALTLAGGSLPKGVELSTAGLVGTPEQIGTFRFAVRASNNCLRVTKTLAMSVNVRPILIVSPSHVTLQYTQHSSVRPEEVVEVEGSWPDLAYSFSVASAPWLRVEPSIGRTPDRESALTGDRVILQVEPADLAPGQYQTDVRFYTRGGENTAMVHVTLDVLKAE